MFQVDSYSLLLERLTKSKFRNSFHLKEDDKKYIFKKGINGIENHAREFIKNRLVPKIILNDGHQTPIKGHPVFIAQHATATCCRKCLYKWHKIEMGKELNTKEQEYIIGLLMLWINNELKNLQN